MYNLYVTKKDGYWGTSIGDMSLSGSKFHFKVKNWLKEQGMEVETDWKLLNGYWYLVIPFKNNEDANFFRLVFAHEIIEYSYATV